MFTVFKVDDEYRYQQMGSIEETGEVLRVTRTGEITIGFFSTDGIVSKLFGKHIRQIGRVSHEKIIDGSDQKIAEITIENHIALIWNNSQKLIGKVHPIIEVKRDHFQNSLLRAASAAATLLLINPK